MLSSSPERMKEIVESADKLGVPRDSAMFKRAMVVSHNYKNSRIDAKRAFLQEALGCSEAEVGIAISKLPIILSLSEVKLGRSVKFLKKEVGLDAGYIVHRPAVLTYSLKRRLIPRHYVLKFLKEKGLLKKEVDFYCAVSQIEKIFIKRFLDPYKKSVPGLADTYSGACAVQVPPEIQP